MSTGAIWDDPSSVYDDDSIVRRIKHRYLSRDLLTNAWVIDAGAFKFDEDGMSIYVSRVLAEFGVPRKHICDDWGQYHAIEFLARQPRSAGAGVVLNEDVGDGKRGKAHGLVRGEKPRLTSPGRTRVREAILASYRWVQEDPSCPEPDKSRGLLSTLGNLLWQLTLAPQSLWEKLRRLR